ncbi:MAG: carbohydrate binding family 9 domain-containing protein [Acidobacteriota bacterium]|nr:carbohydrate binding family 9 domain-containing protein [Acidobacteriota bacterium]
MFDARRSTFTCVARAVALATVFSAPAAAQTLTPRPSLAAVKVAEAPAVDGRVLDDQAWAAAPAGGAFTQIAPDAGAAMSERTEVRVVYTDTTLYIGVVAYDRDPQAIVTASPKRDGALEDTDSIRLILDTYRDRQSGFVFGTSPSALEYDAQVVNEGQGGSMMSGQSGGSGGGFNINWDGTWRVATSTHAEGWSAEFAIPFRTLRYPDAPRQDWGFNLQRTIRRRNESGFWAEMPRQYDLNRLSMAGTLSGLEIPQQRNLKIFPYVLGLSRNAIGSDRTVSKGEVGLDVKYSLTPSLTLDVTVNTDFAQVEIDEQQVNLDRFTLFFPEKRPFFLENAGLFSVGSPGEAEIFFSRSIGIGPRGDPIPILGGARLSGRVGAATVGVLNMQTASVDNIAASTNFTVGRVRRDLPNRSSIGAIFVNRQATGSEALDEDHNRSVALDGRWGLGRYGLLSGFVARTFTPGRDDSQLAYQVSAQRTSPAWDLTASYTDIGRDFNPEVGFLSRRNGWRKPELLALRRIRPENFLGLQELRPHVSYRGYWNQDGFQETGVAHLDNHWEFKSGWEVHTGVNLTREGVVRPFSLSGVLIPSGTYDHQEVAIVGYTPRSKALTYNNRISVGGFFGGDRVAQTHTARLRAGDAFTTELTWSRNDVDLPSGSFVTNLLRSRISYSFTPRIFVQSLAQYNDSARLWSTNVRFAWLQNANTGLFLVYNDTQLTDDIFEPGHEPRFGDKSDRSLTLKFSRVIDVLR